MEKKEIPGFNGIYLADECGNIYSNTKIMKGGKLTIFDDGKGYESVNLYKNTKIKRYYVHRLVMFAFVGESDKEVNHKDFNTKNNKLSNLEYVTPKENIQHYLKSYQRKGVPYKYKEYYKYEYLVKYLRRKGMSVDDISKELDIKRYFIYNIINDCFSLDQF